MASSTIAPADPYLGTNVIDNQNDSIAWEVADFLFGAQSIKNIADGQGTWGDVALVGVTAATFFIPPAKIAMLSKASLDLVITAASKTVATEGISYVAQKAAAKTLDDALAMKRQGYIPTGDELVKRVGRADLEEPTPSYKVPERTIRTEGGREVELPSEKVFKSLGKDKNVKTVSFTEKQIEEGADLNLPENVRVSSATAIDDAFTPGYVPRPEDPTIPRKIEPDETTFRYAADAPSVELTEKLIDEINNLYKKVDKLSDLEFKTQRARILRQLFPQEELISEIPDVVGGRGATELLTSSANITNLKKKEVIRQLKKSEDPASIRLASEIENLDLKTLKQEVVKNADGTRSIREVPYETTPARSAIQPELDNVLYAKERLEAILKEAKSPIDPADASIIKKLTSEIDELDKEAIKLKKFIDDPLSDAAKAQSTDIIPNVRPGRTSTEWLQPRSYRAIKPKPRRIAAPDTAQRPSLSDLEADRQAILMQSKSESRGQALKQINKEIANLKAEQIPKVIPGSKPNLTTGTAGTKKEIKKLEKEIDDLREEWNNVTEPKEMPNGKTLSVEKQRKLISRSAQAKAEMIEKLKNPLSELFVKEPPLPPKAKQYKRAPNTREVINKEKFDVVKAKKELEILRQKYKETPVEDFVRREKLKAKGKILGDKIKAFDKFKASESDNLVVRWNNLTKSQQANTVYIGRSGSNKGKFGNDYEVTDTRTAEEAVELYRKDLWEKIKSSPKYAKDIYALKGKKLGCPGPEENDVCHGQVILKAIKYLDENPQYLDDASKAVESTASTLKSIDSFRGANKFLSNMSDSTFKIDGITYPTVEHFYQAMKTINADERAKILAASTPAQAKSLGGKVKLRKNWKEIQADVMMKALRAKFEQNPELKKKLIDTGDAKLIEGNNWGDKFWGQVNGEGQNWLGRYLMEIRKELMEGK